MTELVEYAHKVRAARCAEMTSTRAAVVTEAFLFGMQERDDLTRRRMPYAWHPNDISSAVCFPLHVYTSYHPSTHSVLLS
jgi:hypothetical protein